MVRLFFVLTKFACQEIGMITLIAGRRLCKTYAEQPVGNVLIHGNKHWWPRTPDWTLIPVAGDNSTEETVACVVGSAAVVGSVGEREKQSAAKRTEIPTQASRRVTNQRREAERVERVYSADHC